MRFSLFVVIASLCFGAVSAEETAQEDKPEWQKELDRISNSPYRKHQFEMYLQLFEYELGLTWDEFVEDGWTQRETMKGDIGIVKLEGSWELLKVTLGGVPYEGLVAVNPPELNLPLIMSTLKSGLQVKFEAGYYKSTPMVMSDGTRFGGPNKASSQCALFFEDGVLTKKLDCPKEKY